MQKKWGLKQNRDASANDKALGNEKTSIKKHFMC